MASLDEENRKKQRQAAEDGPESLAAAIAERSAIRVGGGSAAWFEQFVGKWCYVEGVKLNYRGIFQGVITNAHGRPEGLLFEPMARVGSWGDEPEKEYEETMQGERYIPYGTICDFGEQQGHWPKSVQPIGPRRSR